MTYSSTQLADFRSAYQSLCVVGPEWNLPPFPIWNASSAPRKGDADRGRVQRLVTAHGITKSLTAMARQYGMTGDALRARIRRIGLSDSNVEAALGEVRIGRPEKGMAINEG